MGYSEHSSLPIGSQRLHADFPATVLAIDIANAIPAKSLERDETDWYIVPDRHPTPQEINRFRGEGRGYHPIWTADLAKRIVGEHWGPAAEAYVANSSSWPEMASRYHEALALCALLDSVAKQNAEREKGDRRDMVLNVPPSIDLVGSLELVISRSGQPSRLEIHGLLKSIFHEAQLDRIKRCAYQKCERFFLAGRVDSPCCQESCRNTYKQNRHREREKENRVTRKTTKGINKSV